MSAPKILFIDIETTPNIVHAWGLFNQNIALSQLVAPSRMLCFAAKFKGERSVKFYGDPDTMVKEAHALLGIADIVVHYNGNSFDIPILNAEFAMAAISPPSPSKHVDLYRAVKKCFKFPSGKLEYISRALGLEGKVKHSGHQLWTACMAGDAKAWRTMRQYNMRDVALLEELYNVMLPWIGNHPSIALFKDREGCPNCGSADLRKEGYSYTASGKYQRFQCRKCDAWSKSGRRVSGNLVRGGA